MALRHPVAPTSADWPPGIHPLRPAALELYVSKEDFKFNAAHFVIHEVGII